MSDLISGKETAALRVTGAATAEHAAWMARLELERWTRYRTDPDQALAELIAKELFTAPRYTEIPIIHGRRINDPHHPTKGIRS